MAADIQNYAISWQEWAKECPHFTMMLLRECLPKVRNPC